MVEPASVPITRDATAAKAAFLSVRGVYEELRDHLPIYFVYLEAIGLLHATLANFPPEGFSGVGLSRAWFVPTVALPMGWFVLYFGLRIQRSRTIEARWKAWLALAVAAVGVPALVVAGYRPYPLSHDQLTGLFEGSQFFWVALVLVQIGLSRGGHAIVQFFGVTLVYGLILENTGIVMHFFYEPSFRLYLGPLPAPICTMLGWSLVFYIVVSLVGKLSEWIPWLARGAGRQAWVASAIALSLDAQLDPMASMSGVFWRWNELLPPQFLGVPAINFAAWFGAFLPYSYFVFRVERRTELTAGQRNWELFLRVPLAAALGGAICFGIMAILEGGFDGPSWQILGTFMEKLRPY